MTVHHWCRLFRLYSKVFFSVSDQLLYEPLLGFTIDSYEVDFLVFRGYEVDNRRWNSAVKHTVVVPVVVCPRFDLNKLNAVIVLLVFCGKILVYVLISIYLPYFVLIGINIIGILFLMNTWIDCLIMNLLFTYVKERIKKSVNGLK